MDDQPNTITPNSQTSSRLDPVPSPPAKNNHAHKFIFGYITLIIVAVIIAGVYSWQQKKVAKLNSQVSSLQKQVSNLKSTLNQPKPKLTTTSPNPYAGWKTYSLKYEKLVFEYPSNWAVADTSKSGIDDVMFSANDDFSFSIEDGVSPGGDPIQLASSNPIKVDFDGNNDYIVFTNPAINVGQPAQPDIVSGAMLLTDPSNQNSSPTDKNVINVYNSNFGQAGSSLFVTMGYSNWNSNKLTIAQATSNAEFSNAKLVIESMKY